MQNKNELLGFFELLADSESVQKLFDELESERRVESLMLYNDMIIVLSKVVKKLYDE